MSRWQKMQKILLKITIILIGYLSAELLIRRWLFNQLPTQVSAPYVYALHLYGKPLDSPVPDSGRREVTECLAAFRQSASEQRRAVLWKLAHERWLEWNFDLKNVTSHLTAINRCDLDYAVGRR